MSEMKRAIDEKQLPSDARTAVANSAAMVEIATKWHEETLRFCGLRMNRYFELSSQLWECKSPSDIFKLQTNFLQKMLADYKSETDLVCGQVLNAAKLVTSETIGQTVQPYEQAILKAQQDAAKIIDLAKDQAARIVEDAAQRSNGKTEDPLRGDRRNKSATA